MDMISWKLLTFSFIGYALYISGSLLIISITHLLGLSFKGIRRRNRLLCAGLWQGYREFHHHNPFIFHGHLSLHLSLSWKFSQKKQTESKGKFIMWIHSAKGLEQLINQSYSHIFVTFIEYSVFSGICKVHGNTKFLGANILMGIVL